MTKMKSLLAQMRLAQDAWMAHSGAVDEGRDSFLQQVASRSQRAVFRVRWTPLALAGAGAAAMLLVGALWWLLGDAQPSDATPDAARWYQATADAPLPLHFDSGDEVVLSPGSAARIAHNSDEHAVMMLERGRAELHVVHRANTQWQVNAGPFVIVVTGTRFETTWIPETAHFAVTMREGRVRINGPMLPESQEVRDNQVLTVSLREHRFSLVDPGLETAQAQRDASGDAAHAEALSPTDAAAADEQMPGEDAMHRGASSKIAPTLWVSQARKGRASAAMASVKAEGVASVLRRATPKELLLLADTARLTRDVALAERAYHRVRERAPHTGDAYTAAFSLGKMAFDVSAKYCESARWFETYLDEQKHSSLRREAMGRLMEARQRCGNKTSAQDAARRYLQAYPDGPHAPAAQKLLGAAPINNM
ncbi:MAG: FecR domain-containing protein [Proteobacteria bacterium]|nr:FecR domain-containing protein [Pseudomonadota bacterium]